ncbi:hypothetical protein HID58_024496 [Brassica napus]|uniref:LMBR1-like membrane protein n=1 Tax=Brassica napus TaxID=3708 RepID=A0ABQ7XGE1_BRANA|nr:hypothetical protein HID58_024496 [Brassica napus]
MWVFYLISLPLTLGLVVFTLRYFAGPEIPRYVLITVGYTWFCSVSVIILAPADIWTTLSLPPNHPENGAISFLWSWSYWSTFLLTWAVVPLIQGFEDAGDFTVSERLKTSLHVNLVFYLVLGFVGLLGLILLIMMHRNWNADWTTRQKVLSHKIAKIAVKLDNAHQELSNAIVVAQATSTQMSKRDPMRPYMNVIDAMLAKMFREDPSFKPQGGQLGENDMDYDTDEKSMATLRRHLRNAKEEYYRYKRGPVLEDTMKNYERAKYISSFRTSRSGKWRNLLDTLEFIWRCLLKKHIQMMLAIVTGIMSAAILLAEATLLLSKLDLSLFSILLGICFCTFSVYVYLYILFTLQNWDADDLFLDPSTNKMIARYAPPISYNFINLIQLRSELYLRRKWVESMTLFRSWTTFKFQTETDDMDGFDPSGLMILKKVEMKMSSSYDTMKGSSSNDDISLSENNRTDTPPSPVSKSENMASAKVSLLETDSSGRSNGEGGGGSGESSSRLASTWRKHESRNPDHKKFLPLRQGPESTTTATSTRVMNPSRPQSLDDIFQRLKNRSVEHGHYLDDDDDDDDDES